ncbi:MAG: CHASE2 domain-containing protein [Chitinophagaceae bacterium]|nr:CHASE2 domain-containing protein [Chitinophagaceae bacterium]
MDHQEEQHPKGAEHEHSHPEKQPKQPAEKRPFHKHIGHHARRIHRNVTKYLYERDTIFATLWVFIFIFILGSIPLNLGTLNPIKLAMKDFDMNDLSYAKLGKGSDSGIDTNIVVINIGEAKRDTIALMIEKTASYQPKVMALDVLFDGPRDPLSDSLLSKAFKENPNLVGAAQYILDTGTHELSFSRNYFKDHVHNYGFVNFPADDKESIRNFFPVKKMEHSDSILPSFTASILKHYKPEAYEEMEHHGDHMTMINYTRRATQYLILEGDQLLADEVDGSILKGKIALLAYVNLNPYNIEDKKFTPMNDKFYGKSWPDMNGIFVHANIISMALEDNYVKKLPLWATILIAVLIGWLHMSFFIHYYLENHIWFHLVAKIGQVASAIFFVWLGLYLFDRYRLKVDLKLSLVVIIMAVDVIYFYEAWAVWMHKRFNYRTVFKPHHH